MNHRNIYISSHHYGIQHTRKLVTEAILKSGFEPIWQDFSEESPIEYLQLIRDKIDICCGLVQIRSEANDGDQVVLETEYGSVPYANFELLFAKDKGKRTWQVIVDSDCQYDTRKMLNQFDALNFEPEKDLQKEFFTNLASENPEIYTVKNDNELQNVILDLQIDLQDFHDSSEHVHKLLFTLIFAIFCGLLVLSVSFW